MVDTENLFNNMNVPSHGCKMAFWSTTIHNNNFHRSDITPTRDLVTKHDGFTELDGVTDIEKFKDL